MSHTCPKEVRLSLLTDETVKILNTLLIPLAERTRHCAVQHSVVSGDVKSLFM